MGIRGYYRRLTLEQLDDLRMLTTRKAIRAYLAALERRFAHQDYELCIDKAWTGLHRMLMEHETAHLSCAWDMVEGGTPLADSRRDYGPIRFLTPPEVLAVVTSLEQVAREDALERYKLTYHVTDDAWDSEEAREFNYLWTYLMHLTRFMKAAAQAKDAVIFYLA
jgi:hypothetical protein